MLRGFRWQLLLLVAATILLGIALIVRPQLTPPEENVPPSPPGNTTAVPTSTPQIVAPTPLPPADIATPVVFREGLVGRVQRLNPLFAGLNPVDRDLCSLVFEGLVRTNEYGEYVPALAETWAISGDGLEYVFRLRQDVLWQDGIAFTALDVTTTFGLLQAPGDFLPEDMTAFWRTIEVQMLDEYTVRFRLAQPLAAFLDHMRLGILPAHVFDGLGPEHLPDHPFNLSPIGTGPYQLERIGTDTNGIAAVTLRVAPVYRQRPEGQEGYALERLSFHLYPSQDDALAAFVAGEIDAFGGTSSANLGALEQANAVQTHIGLEPTVGVVLFNWESTYTRAFRDLRTRRALIQGVDRAALVNRDLAGQAVLADSPLIPGSWAYTPVAWPAYDPAAAADLLSAVDFAMPEPEATPTGETAEDAAAEPTAETETSPGPTLTPTPVPTYAFTLIGSDGALLADVAAQWQALGLEINVETLSLAELDARLQAGDFDAALVELTYSPGADPDPYVFWHQGQYQAGQNYGGINDRRTSELIELARRDPNGLHRAQYYADFQREFANRALALLLYYPVYEYAARPGIEGVQIGFLSSPADRFRTIQAWHMPEA
ncbi:MAG: hypothetical protein JW910_03790 [Anaerolineae bacterium]|nr:hypothetical protein [Anaerolineae bacterium]